MLNGITGMKPTVTLCKSICYGNSLVSVFFSENKIRHQFLEKNVTGARDLSVQCIFETYKLHVLCFLEYNNGSDKNACVSRLICVSCQHINNKMAIENILVSVSLSRKC